MNGIDPNNIDDLLFTDGGVMGKNPSKIGGTWAWCLVKGDRIVRFGSGIITPHPKTDIPDAVTNNLTELLAIIKALEEVPRSWCGTLLSDSLISLTRVTTGKKFEGIPNGMRLKALELRRGRKWKYELVAGHPTQSELETGFANRNGNPVSKWNCWCDEECNRLAREFFNSKATETITEARKKLTTKGLKT